MLQLVAVDRLDYVQKQQKFLELGHSITVGTNAHVYVYCALKASPKRTVLAKKLSKAQVYEALFARKQGSLCILLAIFSLIGR